MYILFAVVLSVAAAVYVLTPLFRTTAASTATATGNEQFNELLYQKILAVDTIKDLDFDLQTGKLSSDDHLELVSAQRQLLQKIDNQLGQKSSGKKSDGVRNLENEIDAVKKQIIRDNSRICPSCGSRSGKEARFCSQCGAGLK